jgi:hypothetical protein
MATTAKADVTWRFVVSDVRGVHCSAHARKAGRYARVGMTLNGGIRLEGIHLRVTEDKRWTLSFPQDPHCAFTKYFVRPLDDATRREIECQAIPVLHRQGLTR